MNISQIITLPQIKDRANKIAKSLKGGEVLGLVGNLGSGKTTFTKFLAKNLKIKQRVVSPSFVLMNLFPAKLTNNKEVIFYHLDLYRLKNFKEVKTLGIAEFWGKKNCVTIIEWADKIKKYLPKKTKYLFFNGV